MPIKLFNVMLTNSTMVEVEADKAQIVDGYLKFYVGDSLVATVNQGCWLCVHVLGEGRSAPADNA